MSTKSRKNILAVVGARPQFIKHASLTSHANHFFNLDTVDTGQHYDEKMNDIFFEELNMPKPNYNLNVGSGTHGAQTAKILSGIEEILLNKNYDGCIVYGDTNSTLAGALAASKLNIDVIHIEAGLRSHNRDMPEEVNRIITDHISKLLLVPTENAKLQLKKEGITENVFVTGDIMKSLTLEVGEKAKLKERSPYIYCTIHRPYNTDKKDRLERILDALNNLEYEVVFPIHPRTKNKLLTYGLSKSNYDRIKFIDPQDYVQNIKYLVNSELLLTDSGGMQKEAYWLNKKCITIRTETEWIETLINSCNELVFDNLQSLEKRRFSTEKVGIFDKSLYGDRHVAQNICKLIADLN